MGDMPRAKWRRISSETLEIYAPIANRLGLNETYRELQDLSFRHLMPWRYTVLKKAVTRARSRRRDVLQQVRQEVEQAFARAGLKVRIHRLMKIEMVLGQIRKYRHVILTPTDTILRKRMG